METKTNQAKKATRRIMSAAILSLLCVVGSVVASPAANAADAYGYLSPEGALMLFGDSQPQEFTIRTALTDSTLTEVVILDAGRLYTLKWRHSLIKSVELTGKGGNDLVVIDNVGIDGPVLINMGAGDNRLTVNRTVIGGTFTVKDTSGDLTADFRASTFAARTTVAGGTGSTTVRYDDTNARARTVIKTAFTGQLDLVASASGLEGGTKIVGGKKADSVRIDRATEVRGSLTVDLKGGTDELTFNQGPSIGATVSVRMGGGDDRVIVSATRFTKAVSFNGNGGRDQLTGEASTFALTPEVISFEIS